MTQKKIVSLIDDDIIYQAITKRIAESHENVKQVLQFYDGEEGINYFKENKDESNSLPSLILLDLNMPYMDGWQFIDELAVLDISDYSPDIYIVTSSSNKADIEKAEHYNHVTGYHVKPIKRESFNAFMTKVIGES